MRRLTVVLAAFLCLAFAGPAPAQLMMLGAGPGGTVAASGCTGGTIALKYTAESQTDSGATSTTFVNEIPGFGASAIASCDLLVLMPVVVNTTAGVDYAIQCPITSGMTWTRVTAPYGAVGSQDSVLCYGFAAGTAVGTSKTFNLTWNSSTGIYHQSWMMLAYSGVATVGVHPTGVTSDGAGVTSVPTPNVTTTGVGSWVNSYFTNWRGTSAVASGPAGDTVDYSNSSLGALHYATHKSPVTLGTSTLKTLTLVADGNAYGGTGYTLELTP